MKDITASNVNEFKQEIEKTIDESIKCEITNSGKIYLTSDQKANCALVIDIRKLTITRAIFGISQDEIYYKPIKYNSNKEILDDLPNQIDFVMIALFFEKDDILEIEVFNSNIHGYENCLESIRKTKEDEGYKVDLAEFYSLQSIPRYKLFNVFSIKSIIAFMEKRYQQLKEALPDASESCYDNCNRMLNFNVWSRIDNIDAVISEDANIRLNFWERGLFLPSDKNSFEVIKVSVEFSQLGSLFANMYVDIASANYYLLPIDNESMKNIRNSVFDALAEYHGNCILVDN